MATSDAQLLNQLPPDVAKALEPKLDDEDARDEAFESALRAVAFPEGDVYPLPSEMTAAQRALAELAFRHRLWVRGFGLPTVDNNPERWLGLVPPGPLEEPVEIERDGKKTSVPIWYAMQRAKGEANSVDPYKGVAELLNTLPIGRRLELYRDLYFGAKGHPYDLDPSWVFHHGLRILEDLDAGTGAWGLRMADEILEREIRHKRGRPPLELRLPVFVALVRAKIPIEPRWDTLLPIRLPQAKEATLECIRAIPAERRTAAILAGLAQGNPWEAHRDGYTLLSEFPSAALTKAVLESLARSEDRKKPFMDGLKALAKEHPEVKEALDAYSKKLPAAVKLACLALTKPKSLADLDETQQKQLKLCGTRWDGKDLPAKARIADDNSEESFRGTLEVRVLGNDKPLYDAFSYAVDSGTIFEAGTTTVVAEIVQDTLECENAALKAALDEALRAKPKKAKAKAKPRKN